MRISPLLALPFFVLPWVCALGLFGWILIQRFPPSGIFVATSVMDGAHPFINPFLPSERASVPGPQVDGWVGQRITGDPTYFTSRVPGPYEQVEVEVEFRPLRQPLLEFGIVRDAEGKDLDLAPLYSSELEADNWHETAYGLVKTGVPPARLLNADPVGLITWDAPSTMPLLHDEVRSVQETKTSLRGSHDFYLVPVNNSLDVTFGLQDVNRKRGNTIAVFRLFYGDEEVKHEAFETSGSNETKMGQLTEHRFFLKDARPGVYRISFQADDEVFLRFIKTTSRRWVIGPRLNFGDVVGYATTTFPGHAWTTSRHLVAETFHREGVQTVTFGPSSVNVTRTHEPFRADRFDAQTQPVELFAPNGDIRFIGDGWFALRPDAFFEPKPKRLTDGTSLEREGVEGIVTTYRKPKQLEGEWLRATYTFPLNPSLDRLRFVLSAPGISSRLGAVDIRRITIRYKRDPMSAAGWWSLLKKEIMNAWHRV